MNHDFRESESEVSLRQEEKERGRGPLRLAP